MVNDLRRLVSTRGFNVELPLEENIEACILERALTTGSWRRVCERHHPEASVLQDLQTVGGVPVRRHGHHTILQCLYIRVFDLHAVDGAHHAEKALAEVPVVLVKP